MEVHCSPSTHAGRGPMDNNNEDDDDYDDYDDEEIETL